MTNSQTKGSKVMSEYNRLTSVNECKVIKVIEVRSVVGDGTSGYPIREVVEYYTLDGKRLARFNDFTDELANGVWIDKKGKL